MKIGDRVKIVVEFDSNRDGTYMNGYIGTIVKIYEKTEHYKKGYIIDTDIPYCLGSTRYVFDEECLELIDVPNEKDKCIICGSTEKAKEYLVREKYLLPLTFPYPKETTLCEKCVLKITRLSEQKEPYKIRT